MADDDRPVSATFRQPFEQQAAAWRLRLRELRPTSGSADPNYTGHARAFMVAGAVKADLLADLGAAVDRAVIEGTGFEAFKEDFRGIVSRHGWHGWTGEGTAAGEEWRMRTIYDTNMRVSYMAGRHAQLVAGKFRFWIYFHSGATHPRLNHLAWNGIALPPDHPFWKKHFPPNGWGCGCRVVGTNSVRGVRRLGGDPDKQLPEGWDAVDPRTGEPPGIGRGWGTSPSVETSELVETMARKAVDWPTEIASAYMEEVPDAIADRMARAFRAQSTLGRDLRRYSERVIGERNGAKLGPVIVEAQRTLGHATPDISAQVSAATGETVGRAEFILDREAVRRTLAGNGGATPDVQWFAQLPQVLNAPDSIESAGVSDAGRPRVAFSREIGGVRFTVVLEVGADGVLRVVDITVG